MVILAFVSIMIWFVDTVCLFVVCAGYDPLERLLRLCRNREVKARE